MKKLLIATFSLLFGLLVLTACENQTDGLLPEPTAQAAPPEYVLAAVKLQYPNATNVKITVIQPNKIWRVEFTVNGEIFETFIDENGKTITNGRLGTVDENEALEKVLAYIRAQKRNFMTIQVRKIRHPESRNLLYFTVIEFTYYIPEGNYANDTRFAYLFDRRGDFMEKKSIRVDNSYKINQAPANGEIRTTFNAYFDMETKSINWGAYKAGNNDFSQLSAEPTEGAIYNTLQRLGWADYSSISPVLTREDYPYQMIPGWSMNFNTRVYRNADNAIIDLYETRLGWSYRNPTQILNGRYPMTSPMFTKYGKFFDESPARFTLFTQKNGKPIYISESPNESMNHWQPFSVRTNITRKEELPTEVIQQISSKNLPDVQVLIKGQQTVSEIIGTGFGLNIYNIFYKGVNEEMVQLRIAGTWVGYQIITPISETEIRPEFLSAVKAQYPNLRILKYHKFSIEDKMEQPVPSITDYNGQEIIFEADGKTYTAVVVGASGFNNPIINQLF
ncbi:MAG: hypothetical protein MUE30_15165 [Spirosomaceae bacterium]|jgi:hypothetical protein|nr:hypothetical protein [Spirosomataceae bacterium]